MNPRIRELALQAGYQEDMFGLGHWDMPECRRFVDLIVRECISLCQESIDDGCVEAEEPMRKIRRHFGVAE
jgi:hypothetical protein